MRRNIDFGVNSQMHFLLAWVEPTYLYGVRYQLLITPEETN